MFLVGTVALVPVEQLVARQSTAGRRAVTRRSLALAGVVGLTAVLTGGFVAATRDSLFAGASGFVVQAVVLVLLGAPVAVVRGLLNGHRRFDLVGATLALDGVGRLVFGLAGLTLLGGAVGYGWGIALAALPILALAPRAPRLARAAPAAAAAGDLAFLAPYVGAGAASQLLLAGAPLAVAALGGSPADISIVFVTFTLFRAPVTIVYLLQSRLLNALVRLELAGEAARLARLQRRIVLAALGLVVTASAGAWAIGPAVVALLYGPGFSPGRTVAALAAAGVAAAAGAQLLGQVLVARGATATLARRWSLGLVVALVTLLLAPRVGLADPALAVAVAFALGEAASAVAMARTGARRRDAAGTGGRTGRAGPRRD